MRFTLLALAALVLAPAAFAQSFGLKAGLNTATVFFDDDDQFDEEGVDKQPRLGFVGGITADLPITPALGVRAEALYAQRGFNTAFDFEGDEVIDPVSGDQTLKLDYLEVPVMMRYMIPLQDGLEVSLLGGATPAFLLNSSVECSGDNEFVDELCDLAGSEEEPDGEFESFDLGGALGLEVGAGPFSVEGRYTYGFLDVATDDDVRANNGVFSITATYRFGR